MNYEMYGVKHEIDGVNHKIDGGNLVKHFVVYLQELCSIPKPHIVFFSLLL